MNGSVQWVYYFSKVLFCVSFYDSYQLYNNHGLYRKIHSLNFTILSSIATDTTANKYTGTMNSCWEKHPKIDVLCREILYSEFQTQKLATESFTNLKTMSTGSEIPFYMFLYMFLLCNLTVVFTTNTPNGSIKNYRLSSSTISVTHLKKTSWPTNDLIGGNW